MTDPPTADNREGDRFAAAWRFATGDRSGFSVCVRAEASLKPPGFRLLTPADARVLKPECLWLHEIDEAAEGFVGRAREPLGRLAGVVSNQWVPFTATHVAHWTFAGVVVTRPAKTGEVGPRARPGI